jgi:hypothetical protein
MMHAITIGRAWARRGAAKWWLACWALLAWAAGTQAQGTSCAQSLSKAQVLYDQGKLLQLEPLLAPCLKSGFTQEERAKAYRLLTLAYLFSDHLPQAHEAFARLLRLKPDFVAKPDEEPQALVALYRAYRTSPWLSVGLAMGAAQTQARSMQAYSTVDTEGQYEARWGVQVGLSARIYLHRHVSIDVQGLLAQASFGYRNTLLGYSELTYQERQQWLALPVLATVHVGNGRLQPYAFGGAAYWTMLQAKGSAQRQQDVGRDVSLGDVDMASLRQSWQIALQGGAGLLYRTKRTGLFAQASYLRPLGLANLPNERYSQVPILYQTGYVDHDFRLRQIQIQVGITYSFFRPKLLKDKIFKDGIPLDGAPQ